MFRIAAICSLWCFFTPDLAHADALIQTLPPDGSWVSFQVNLKVDGQETRPIWSIRSVGKKVVDGDPCRWIELHSSVDGKIKQLVKALVAEKEFGAGKNPLGKARTVWIQFGEGKEADEISSLAERDPALAAILEGPTANVQKREKKETIPWQNGNFECDVYDGKSSQDIFGNKLELAHTVWKHADIPFGIAAMKQGIKLQIGNQTTTGSIEMTLKEFGKDAKSSLPKVE